ncbi:CCA tRNA nucleotidyltransferase [Granulicella cerasi]|uniref:CCA tRNA nucleotidyltransferase n=1 Tax=Granulicella cerasi TaxID=741063 RepID=A0ABW1Z8J7_9BACT|nr:CCA tRNA nucleotidyltransferase [Granulicella cerasi]
MSRLEHPRLSDPRYRAALAVVERLRAHGFEAVFAGGCVRDLLLGVAAKDYDVATSARPEQVQALFPNSNAIGAHFGVVQVVGKIEDERIATEVATFRHDGAYSDGRRPEAVQYATSAAEDVARRDFTINGLLLDVARFEAGATLEASVLDYCGGIADLCAGVVRAIGDPARRFDEDKLRLLRAVRFAARLNFVIEPQTFAAMQREAANIEQVSKERIANELTLILTQGHARRGLELLDASGLLQHVLPEVSAMHGVEQPPQYHPEGDVWVHTLMLLEHLPVGASATLAWGMLLHDVGKPATFTPPDPAKLGDRIRFNGHAERGVEIAREILNRLRFSNEAKEQILALVKHHMQFGEVEKMKPSTLKRFLRMPQFDEHLALHYADVMSAHRILGAYAYAKHHYENSEEEALRPALFITGAELIASGLKPGPEFKQILTAAEDAQLEGQFASQEEAQAWLARFLAQGAASKEQGSGT